MNPINCKSNFRSASILNTEFGIMQIFKYECLELFHNIHTQHSLQRRFPELLAVSTLSPCFRINSTICFGHTGPSSGVYDDWGKLLYCTIVLYTPRGLYVQKVYYLNKIGSY
jgi:hypothetical protein